MTLLLHYITDADAKGLCGMYERIVMIPRPDYASRLGQFIVGVCMVCRSEGVCMCIICMQPVVVIWRNLVLRNGGRITDMLDLSCLAKVTDGYTPGHMNTAVTQVLNERRIAQVKKLKSSSNITASLYCLAPQETSGCI